MPTAFLHQLKLNFYTEVLFLNLCSNYYFQHPQFKMSGDIQNMSSHILNFQKKNLNEKKASTTFR